MTKHIRLYFITEGPTEEEFVKSALTKHLSTFNVFCFARSVTTRTHKGIKYTGGGLNFDRVCVFIDRFLKQDSNNDARFTTMFDLYALDNKFPNYESAMKLSNPYDRVALLQSGLKAVFQDHRFIPYFQLHEFESLILANPDILKEEYWNREREIEKLKQTVLQIGNPELVNDTPSKAPSKRIIDLIPEFEDGKPRIPAELAAMSGVPLLKSKCPNFASWMEQLEQLAM